MTILLRDAIGERLRRTRTAQRRTLREVARAARVSLGYLSEVERGRKEASSELLAAICDALDLPLDELLRRVVGDLDPMYLSEVPDTVPSEFMAGEPGTPQTEPTGQLEGGRLVTSDGRPTAHDAMSDLRLATYHRIPDASPGKPRAVVGAAA